MVTWRIHSGRYGTEILLIDGSGCGCGCGCSCRVLVVVVLSVRYHVPCCVFGHLLAASQDFNDFVSLQFTLMCAFGCLKYDG